MFSTMLLFLLVYLSCFSTECNKHHRTNNNNKKNNLIWAQEKSFQQYFSCSMPTNLSSGRSQRDFIEVSVMYLWIMGIYFVSFYEFTIGLWSWSESVVSADLHFDIY